MTREEHLKWCKERAIQEYDYYAKDKKGSNPVQQGLTSMLSDLRKHPETQSNAMSTLCLIYMMRPMSRQEFVTFINGFN